MLARWDWLTSRQKTEDAPVDKGKGKAAAPPEEEAEAAEEEDEDESDDELIVRGPRKRKQVDYSSVSVWSGCLARRNRAVARRGRVFVVRTRSCTRSNEPGR